MDISEKIRGLREAYGLTRDEFGKKLGVTGRTVSKWEHGTSMPGIRSVQAICRTYNLSMDYLFKGTEEAAAEEKELAEKPMASIRELYKAGRGPSSSHTMGPERACLLFMERHPEANSFRAVLFGSLALTGRGHGTDRIIEQTLGAAGDVDIEWDLTEKDLPHENTMDLYAYKDGTQTGYMRVCSVGGGQIVVPGEEQERDVNVYPLHSFEEIAGYCREHDIRIWQYVDQCEDGSIDDYIHDIWVAMQDSIHAGLEDSGILPGGLDVYKKARYLYEQERPDESEQTKENRIVCSFAYAVSEQNAAGGRVVTAPTCGSCGVVPAVMYYEKERAGHSDREIENALKTAALVGDLIKTNASISGAECGCQAEVGAACAMAAAALAELYGMSIDQIEYSAEIAIEHHLGLTCDPISGLVQIPCIERNAVAAMRAINAVNLANFLTDTRKISLDLVIRTMYETGKDLPTHYRETGEGGLAKLYKKL